MTWHPWLTRILQLELQWSDILFANIRSSQRMFTRLPNRQNPIFSASHYHHRYAVHPSFSCLRPYLAHLLHLTSPIAYILHLPFWPLLFLVFFFLAAFSPSSYSPEGATFSALSSRCHFPFFPLPTIFRHHPITIS